MRRNITIAIVALITLGVISYVGVTQGASIYVPLEALINRVVDASSDDTSIRVEFANTVSDFTVKNETALTNTVDPTFQIQHNTTGTAAAGIGTSMDFKQETAAANDEIGARIAAVTTDVTATSEDFKLDFMTMAGGAAAATSLSIGSTGILTMAGATTLDNTTSANELNITETAIQLTGATDLEGGVVTVNDDSGDYDFTVESNDVADALKVDAGLNVISHGTWVAYDYITSTAQSYSLASTGRAANIIQTVAGEDGTLHLMTELLTTPGAGAVITIKTGNTQTVTIDTEGSETIDGGATYTLDANYEAVTLTTDGTNWFVLSGYLE